MTTTTLNDYLQNMSIQNSKTATVVRHFLADYTAFVKSKYGVDLDSHVGQIKSGDADVYESLMAYVQYLDATKLKTGKNSPATVRQKIKSAKRFLEYSDIDISPAKFKLKVKMPKSVRREKSPLTKEMVREILNACQDIRLKTFIMWLASSGWRSSESMSLRIRDLDLSKSPGVVHIPGENTKTKTDRHTYLTAEMEKQLKEWLAYKYRARTNVLFNRQTQGWDHVKLKPVQRPTDYIFLPYHEDATFHENPRTLEYAYGNMQRSFLQLAKRLGYRTSSNGKHCDLTFHTFRRLVYTTIDGLGLNQFAEYYIGHSTSEYWNKPEAEKISTFRRIEPYLTYLDLSRLEVANADIEAQLLAKDHEIMSLKSHVGTEIKQLQEVLHRERALGNGILSLMVEYMSPGSIAKREKIRRKMISLRDEQNALRV